MSPRQFGDGASRRKRCSSGGTGPRGGVGVRRKRVRGGSHRQEGPGLGGRVGVRGVFGEAAPARTLRGRARRQTVLVCVSRDRQRIRNAPQWALLRPWSPRGRPHCAPLPKHTHTARRPFGAPLAPSRSQWHWGMERGRCVQRGSVDLGGSDW